MEGLEISQWPGPVDDSIGCKSRADRATVEPIADKRYRYCVRHNGAVFRQVHRDKAKALASCEAEHQRFSEGGGEVSSPVIWDEGWTPASAPGKGVALVGWSDGAKPNSRLRVLLHGVSRSRRLEGKPIKSDVDRALRATRWR